MRNIGEFFSRIQNRHAKEVFLRKTIQEVIYKVSKVELPLEKIGFKGLSLILKGLNSSEKSEIHIKKAHILRALGGASVAKVVNDIKFLG